MKARLVRVLILAVTLSVLMTTAALADQPVVFYDDTEAVRTFPHDGAKGPSYVRNGAFDEWAELDGMPIGWQQYTSGSAATTHFAKMDLADPRAAAAGDNNFALGLMTLCNSGDVPPYAIAYSQLSVPVTGDYWVTVHVTAWGEDSADVSHNSEAWYAVYPTNDPTAVPDSAWRELYPDSRVCPNDREKCNLLGRSETVRIQAGSSIFLKGQMKFPDYYAWTVFGWDDIGVWDMVPATVWPYSVLGWLDDGDVRWDQYVPR